MIKSERSSPNFAALVPVKGVGIDVTLVMPTRHRLNFVKAYITFLSTLNFGGHLVIADGSDNSLEAALTSHFEGLAPIFRLTVVAVPKEGGDGAWININKCILEAGQHIDTCYACLCFDDDFTLPSFLDKATQILDADHSVGFVVGGQLSLELTARDRLIPWPCRAHNVGNIRGISAMHPVSRMANFFASPYQLAYSVVRAPTFLRYVASDHQHYFFASLSSDYSWYCAVLASGTGVAVPECGVLRLVHDSNTKTYGQGAAEVYEALLDGRTVADAERLQRRIEGFTKTSPNHGDVDVDTEAQQLLPVVVLSIISSLISMPCRSNVKVRSLSWFPSVASRIMGKASNLVMGMRSYKNICALDKILRVNGL